MNASPVDLRGRSREGCAYDLSLRTGAILVWIAAFVVCVIFLTGCAVLAGGAAGAATGYVAGHEAAKD